MAACGAAASLVASLARRETGRLVASLARVIGARNLSLAEDCVQEAFASALATWDERGIPDNPVGWLTTAARNRAVDVFRRNALFAAIEPNVVHWMDALRMADAQPLPLGDEELSLMILCCHPALPEETRIALTLKTVCGFTVEEIARAFLAKPETIAQRLVRAKTRIRELGLEFSMPSGAALDERMPSVLRTIYLLFNEGYAASDGDSLIREDICGEALRLSFLVSDHALTRSPVAHALAALLSFQHARRGARVKADGTPFLLDAQDRALWDHALIARGFAHLRRAQAGNELSTYHLEAGIASVHAASPSWDATDWSTARRYYDLLMEIAPSSVVAVNRAVAIARIDGPDIALDSIAHLAGDPAMRRYVPFHLTVGDLELQRGRRAHARAAFEQALALPLSAPERALVEAKLRACADG